MLSSVACHGLLEMRLGTGSIRNCSTQPVRISFTVLESSGRRGVTVSSAFEESTDFGVGLVMIRYDCFAEFLILHRSPLDI